MRGQRDEIQLEGDVPSPMNPPHGCRFHTRCWRAREVFDANADGEMGATTRSWADRVPDVCRTDDPELARRGEGEHPAACHFAQVRDVVHKAH
jgi:ABC-type oligopeptide transport system ATPase subunit